MPSFSNARRYLLIWQLQWIESQLAVRGELEVWVDSDTLVVDPTLHVTDWTHTFFGEECWV